jgi:hypothetical protein
MISLHSLLEAWKLIPSADRLFHSRSFELQRSLILMQLKLAKVHPSLRPLVPSGLLLELVIRGLSKMGYLSILAMLVKSDLTSPDLTLI